MILCLKKLPTTFQKAIDKVQYWIYNIKVRFEILKRSGVYGREDQSNELGADAAV